MEFRKNWSYYKPGDLLDRLRQREEEPEFYQNPYITQALAMGKKILTASDLLGWQNNSQNQQTPMILEVGCYKGTTLTAMARENPHCHFLGIDIKYKRVVITRRKLDKAGIDTQVQIAIIDLIDCLEILPPDSLNGVCIFYPDPWSKDRFEERRLFSPYTVNLLMKSLSDEGFIWIKTDHADYLQQIDQSLKPFLLTELAPPPPPLKAAHYPTDFENLFQKQNKQTFELCLKKNKT